MLTEACETRLGGLEGVALAYSRGSAEDISFSDVRRTSQGAIVGLVGSGTGGYNDERSMLCCVTAWMRTQMTYILVDLGSWLLEIINFVVDLMSPSLNATSVNPGSRQMLATSSRLRKEWHTLQQRFSGSNIPGTTVKSLRIVANASFVFVGLFSYVPTSFKARFSSQLSNARACKSMGCIAKLPWVMTSVPASCYTPLGGPNCRSST